MRFPTVLSWSLALVPSLFVGLACSSFKSSSSPSRWSSDSFKASSSPSRWSSESSEGSGPTETEAAEDEADDLTDYERDLRDTTVSIVAAGGQPREVSQAIYPVAFEYGVTDYSGDPGTYRAIGKGLGLARLSLGEFDRYREHLAGGSDVKKRLLMEGYTSTR